MNLHKEQSMYMTSRPYLYKVYIVAILQFPEKIDLFFFTLYILPTQYTLYYIILNTNINRMHINFVQLLLEM